MIQYHVYPGGKKRIVTFSYDDGSDNDKRLVALFNRYGVKGTFHLNSSRYANMSADELASVRALYEGHEIACHTVSHGWPSRMPAQSALRETWEDRLALERIAGYPVVGMSYPSGSYDEGVEQVMSACGIVYSRTTKSTLTFNLPEDFLAWHPTCHHRDALSLCDKFINGLDSQWERPLFYIWGHSHEFRTEEDWQYIENVLRRLSGLEQVWYATNVEIYDYFAAQKQLRISADETVFVNPTSVPLWVERDKKDILCIPAGSTLRA